MESRKTTPVNPEFLRLLKEDLERLEKAIMEATGTNGIRWTPGLKPDGSCWKGMEFMRPGGKMLDRWNQIWPPAYYPEWDAMARVRPGRNSWERLYIKAYSRPEEMKAPLPPGDDKALEALHHRYEDAKTNLMIPGESTWPGEFPLFLINLSVLGFLKGEKSCGHLLFIHLHGCNWSEFLRGADRELGLDILSKPLNRVHRIVNQKVLP